MVFLSTLTVAALLHLYCPSIQFRYREDLLGSSLVGDACSTNTACVLGAYCKMGTCSCKTSHITIGNYCWKKLLPEESGCTFDAQCDSSWPRASCRSGVCKCPSPLHAAATREGTVCHPIDECPTNGRNALLYNRNTNTPSKCFLLSQDSWEFMGCDDYPEVHDCIGGLCCPTRALSCIQPMDIGQSSAGNFTTTRWYHDPISYSCQSFQFAGAGGNANNFLTKELCESYCLSKFICSEFGGVSSESTQGDSFQQILPYSSGSQREGQHPVTRWYWDRMKKDCLPFIFYGQGGNFNNFLTKEHCNSFCSVALCPFGSPLLQVSGSPTLCTSTAECPAPYSCQSGRCCPSSESVCNQPMSEGVLCIAAPLPRFWFNASAGNCQLFMYNGCQGNSNIFQSLEACQQTCEGTEVEPRCRYGSALRTKEGKLHKCGSTSFGTECPINYECVNDGPGIGCCPTSEYICSLPRSIGRPCEQTPTLRWYFDEISGTCRSFLFQGCDGNINNFPTKQSCDEFCPTTAVSSCPFGGTYHRRENGEVVECFSDEQCPSNYSCVTSMSHRGNEVRHCCPTRLAICLQGRDEGSNCGQPARRYFFDKVTRQCRQMRFMGCGGNSNNFPSEEICYNYCLSSACSTFEVVLLSSSLGAPFDCSKSPCPRGYSCVADVLNPRKMVCCGAPNTDVCPDGLQSLSDPRTLLPKSCRGSQYEACPPGFHCLLHPTKKRHYCCGSTKRTESCPSGTRLFRLATGEPLGCNSQSLCPEGSTCHKSNPAGSGLCCKALLNVCPSGFVLDQSPIGECSPLDRSHCSSTSNSICLFADTLQRFVCCKKEDHVLALSDCCPADPHQKVVCRTPMDVGFACRTAGTLRYYFDTRTSRCHRFLFRGCGGNANNFLDEASCTTACGPFGVARLATEPIFLSRRFPNDQQCSASKLCNGQTVCVNGRCICRPGQVQLRGMCYWRCPANRENIGGICV